MLIQHEYRVRCVASLRYGTLLSIVEIWATHVQMYRNNNCFLNYSRRLCVQLVRRVFLRRSRRSLKKSCSSGTIPMISARGQRFNVIHYSIHVYEVGEFSLKIARESLRRVCSDEVIADMEQ